MAKVYSYWDGEESHHFERKRDCIKDAQDMANYLKKELVIEEHTIVSMSKVQLLIAGMHGGWSASMKKIKWVYPKEETNV